MILVTPIGVLCIVLALVVPAPGSELYGSKRGRPQYSSLIPFPRVGRSGGGEYYGQKRAGKSGLIPFPRVGKRVSADDVDSEDPWVEHWVGASQPMLTLLPRIGRSSDKSPGEEDYLWTEEGAEISTAPSKRQSLIPFPRVGKRQFSPADRSFHRRLLRSDGSNDFKRRITRSSGDSAFSRRILRDSPVREGFRRRITRSQEATPAPEVEVAKRQSLIPFPRTGKRSASTAAPGEMDQVYIYEEVDGEENEEEMEDAEEEASETDLESEGVEDSLGPRGRTHHRGGAWRIGLGRRADSPYDED